MKSDGFVAKSVSLIKKHRRLSKGLLVFLIVYMLLLWVGSMYRPFSPEVLLSKETADNVKTWILNWGWASSTIFILLQIAQVIFAPVPGQATGFVGGYVFGWEMGVIYSMTGLTLGSLIVFVLARKLGRPFVERFNPGEAVTDFERMFIRPESKSGEIYGKSKKAVGQHGVFTFFMVMLLPVLPDDLVCFVGGLSGIPIWKLLLAAVLGRFPGMLVLSMVGDGFSKAQSNMFLLIFIAITCVLTGVYFWKKKQLETFMLRLSKRGV